MQFNFPKIIVAGVVAAACSSALADSFDLAVKGTVKPAACTPVLTGGGSFDYGVIPLASLNPIALTLLEVKSDTLTITCDAAARVALKAADSRAGTGAFAGNVAFFGANAGVTTQYGLGTASGKNIGAYAFRLKTGTFKADGAEVDSIYSSTSGASWSSTNGLMSHAGGYESWARKGMTNPIPIAAKVFTGVFELQAAIDRTSNLDMSKEVALDGLATVSLVYL